MLVTLNTISPKYNNYQTANNRPKQQPAFSGLSDKAGDVCAKHLIPKVFDNKVIDKLTDKVKNSDNLFKHFLAVGSAITSGMYMYKTVTNDKLDKDRKNTLAVNQFLTFVLSTAGAYALDGYLGDWWQKQTAKYAAKSLEDPTIHTDFLKEFKAVKEEAKKIKAFNKTASMADKKDVPSLKAEKFIKERLGKYIVDKNEKALFMKRISGMGYLKSMLVFSLVYRYIVPVMVTKPANKLCNMYLAHKESKKEQKVAQKA